jgi:hypothetical protein
MKLILAVRLSFLQSESDVELNLWMTTDMTEVERLYLRVSRSLEYTGLLPVG